MGMRKYRRQIAKARMTALGVGNVNRQMSREQNGMKNWRRALSGETGDAGLKAQMLIGKKIKERKAKNKVVQIKARHKIRKVSA